MSNSYIPNLVIKEVFILYVLHVLFFSISSGVVLSWGSLDLPASLGVLSSYVLFVGNYLHGMEVFNMLDAEERGSFLVGLFISFLFACMLSLTYISY